MPREWNSAAYHALSAPQFGWGLKVLERLRGFTLRGDEHILDAGCGTGRVTAALLQAFPGCRVTAVDASANMVQQARQALTGFGDRVTVRQLDLLELSEADAFDVVFSTAVFHWIKDRDRLFSNLFRSLRRGGFLLAQCGGGPNLKRLRARVANLVHSPIFAESFGRWREITTYAGPDEIAEQLQRAGFVEVKTGLEEAPVPFEREEDYRNFLSTMILHPHLERLPEELQGEFLDALVAHAKEDEPPLVLDYWRLNLFGRKI
ncbi:MAG TPA: methyltransferase domain-containing protein [Candidatus Limnocylindrales bacterium]|nr:methyltransferase domain-containing protein [Candidatus Limnocylindrales bacterium]